MTFLMHTMNIKSMHTNTLIVTCSLFLTNAHKIVYMFALNKIQLLLFRLTFTASAARCKRCITGQQH